ncbi:MAG: GAF domain-containing protein, partial [Chloroflexota bacterium]
MSDQKGLSFFLSTSAWVKWGALIGLTFVIILIFEPLVAASGPASASLIALPVIAAGWFFGPRGAFIFSILAVTLGHFLLVSAGLPRVNWYAEYLVPGNLILILVGIMAGALRGWVNRQAKTELALRSRERYLALTSMMTQAILAGKPSDEMYNHLASNLTNLFEGDYSYITQWDSTRGLVYFICTTLPLEDTPTNTPLEAGEAELIKSVIQTGSAHALTDLSSSHKDVIPSFLQQASRPTESILMIPLITGDFKFGAVVVAFATSRHYAAEDLARAEQVGKNVTLALSSIHQKEQIQKRLKEANALANIERALSKTESVGLATVLEFIVNSAKDLITGAQQGVIHLLDEKEEFLVAHAVTGRVTTDAGEFRMRPGEGAAGQAIAGRAVINIQDITRDLRFLQAGSVPSYRSLLVAPIHGGDKPIGTISVQSNQTHAFSPENMELLSTLSIHASIAIENARLFEATQQRLKEVNALYRINQGLVASIDADQLMKDVVSLLQKSFGYDHVQIYVMDSQSGDLTLVHDVRETAASPQSDGYLLEAGLGIVGHVAQTGEPFMTNDVDSVVFFYRSPLLPDTKSELTVPIKVENKVVGIIDVQQTSRQFKAHDLQLVSAVADQLAVALQKANLYTDLQHSLNQEKAMRTQLVQSERLAVMGRLLASVSHELNNPLQAIQNALYLLREEKGLSAQGQQDLEIVLSESERMAAMIERLRATYRPHHIRDFKPVQLNGIIEDVYALIATHLRHNEISFEFYPDPELPLIPGLT